uniref:Uncharacterized protein n=1 Tax=Oryza brachyantha TaxID=4533 RepID=J3LHL6_ORYBR
MLPTSTLHIANENNKKLSYIISIYLFDWHWVCAFATYFLVSTLSLEQRIDMIKLKSVILQKQVHLIRFVWITARLHIKLRNDGACVISSSLAELNLGQVILL